MDITNLINQMVARKAASLHLSAGVPALVNIHGRFEPISDNNMDDHEINQLVNNLITPAQVKAFLLNKSLHFTYLFENYGRMRVTFFKQKGLTNAIFRPIPINVPELEKLGLPESLKKIAKLRSGLVIIGGPAGCGKSTTLAAILNEINKLRSFHVITLEDPIEYFFNSEKSLFSQREIGIDTFDFANALRAAIRQDADVIMISDMHDVQTIRTALVAAETGVLVIANMHTTDCVQTITRLISAMPAIFQNQVRTQVSMVLKSVVSQQLVLCSGENKRIPAVEIMFTTPGIINLIRDNKIHQIYNEIENGNELGMQTLDQALGKLHQNNQINDLELVSKSANPTQLKRKLFDQEIPLTSDSGPGFIDVGEDLIPIDKKIIRYQANFTPGLEGYWTSSVAVTFKNEGLTLLILPGMPIQRIYLSDFNIVSKRVLTFELTHRLIIRFKTEHEAEFKNDVPQLLVKLFTQPEGENLAKYNKINLTYPLTLDDKWHTWVITIPEAETGKLLKITMLEFPSFLTKVVISDMIFF
ncbi:MAG: PilT/PilU family type 4a pilus ATPase [Candidatus Omnitrophica bacterium]|nr:PilT/PilU family type 4a pilus ATPase [Candidatus Omnitrophota bacterium]